MIATECLPVMFPCGFMQQQSQQPVSCGCTHHCNLTQLCRISAASSTSSIWAATTLEYEYPDPSEDDYELALSMPQRLTSESLAGLQHLHKLTYLHLTNFTWFLDTAHPPGITQLTALRSLKLWANYEDLMIFSPNPYPDGLNPAVLSAYSGLQGLTISLRQTWHPADMSALLAGVGCMRSSAHYTSATALGSAQQQQPTLALQQAAACRRWSSLGAISQVAPGCICFLQASSCQSYRSSHAQVDGRDLQHSWQQLRLCRQLQSSRLASCCPDLRNIELRMPGMLNNFAALGQLTGLKNFWFSAYDGLYPQDPNHLFDQCAMLSTVSSLESLSIGGPFREQPPYEFSAARLLKALQHLTFLRVGGLHNHPANGAGSVLR